MWNLNSKETTLKSRSTQIYMQTRQIFTELKYPPPHLPKKKKREKRIMPFPTLYRPTQDVIGNTPIFWPNTQRKTSQHIQMGCN